MKHSTDFQFGIKNHNLFRRYEKVHFGRRLTFPFGCLTKKKIHWSHSNTKVTELLYKKTEQKSVQPNKEKQRKTDDKTKPYDESKEWCEKLVFGNICCFVDWNLSLLLFEYKVLNFITKLKT